MGGGRLADSAFSRGLRRAGAASGQTGVRSDFLLAALAAVALPAAAAKHSASAAIDFRVAVPRVMALQLDGHPARVQVTAQDVARGELVVRGPRVRITANAREGFLLRAELRGAAFRGFEVDGLPALVGCDCTSTQAPMRVAGNRLSTEVAYRLRLAPDAGPGEYGWPLTLSLQDP